MTTSVDIPTQVGEISHEYPPLANMLQATSGLLREDQSSSGMSPHKLSNTSWSALSICILNNTTPAKEVYMTITMIEEEIMNLEVSWGGAEEESGNDVNTV